MAEQTYHVRGAWDAEAGVWIATSDDVSGLCRETAMFEELVDTVLAPVPGLPAANGAARPLTRLRSLDGVPGCPERMCGTVPGRSREVAATMTSKHLSVVLPPELYAEVEAACRRERRSRAAIVREALTRYFARRILVEESAPDELEAIREGREALTRGEYVSLEEWRREVGLDRDQAGAEGPARRARARSPADR